MNKLYLFLLLIVFAMSCKKDHFAYVTNPTKEKKEFILAGEKGDGIYYHDITPDWIRYAYGLIGDSINIDMNDDNAVDICIKYSTITSSSSYITQTSVNCLNGAMFSLSPKNMNDTINAPSSWSSTISLLSFTKIDFATSDTTVSGPWISTSDKFLGVKVMHNGKATYGWIRMDLIIHPATVYVQEITVKDFAWRNSE